MLRPPMTCYETWIKPLLFQLDPESAHRLSMGLLDAALAPSSLRRLLRSQLHVTHPAIQQKLWGRDFSNPVGLAAGFDKNGEHVRALAALGFSHIEVGSVTGQEQPGNPRPRCFRLPRDRSLINRMGFNNHGAQAVGARLSGHYGEPGDLRRPPVVLGVNIGKSKAAAADETIDDHLRSVDAVAHAADYLVVNVSCPNVQGVTGLQEARSLTPLLNAVAERLRLRAPGCRLLLKVAPDLSTRALDEAVDIALETGVSGLLATNTSTGRSGLETHEQRVQQIGNGGLSGAAIRSRADQTLAHIAKRVDGRLPLIGLGGIEDAETAWRKICLGANLVQIYTGFVYHGPLLPRRICQGLLARLQRHGLGHISEAVGRDL